MMRRTRVIAAGEWLFPRCRSARRSGRLPATTPRISRPQSTEWRHLQVQWITDVVAARKQAAKEDKPMVVLYTGGAGYNEPLGVC